MPYFNQTQGNQSPTVDTQFRYKRVDQHTNSTMKTPSNVLRQTRALMLRYIISSVHRPISSLIRLIIWPGVVLGLVIYLLANAQQELISGSSQMSVKYVTTILLFITAFIVYSYCDWMIKDRFTGIKSLMLTMGLKRWSYYLANITIMILSLSLIVITMATIVTEYLLVDTSTSKFLVYVLFIMFMLQLIALTHVVASLITSTSYSSIMIILLFFEQSPSLLFNMGMANGGKWRPVLIFLDTLSPYGSIRILAESYLMNKNNGTIDYDDKKSHTSAPTHLLVIYSFIWTVIFFSLARWFEEVCPWQRDSAVKGSCFCFQTQSEFGNIEATPDTELESQDIKHYFEQRRNENRDIGIRVSRACKSFKSVPAINNVSFNIYQGETTLLLGHNGAGKSTLMNIILGLLSPDSGRVGIKNFSSYGRSGVGVCPQTSILDDDLTVKQHLDLFVGIKSSMNSFDRDIHVRQTLDDVNLTSHAYKRPAELSGGMKRKLSLGLAFVGKSDVLILDEPSSGLDPDSRVFIWNAIRRNRANRTVLLSTQHMEEADYLGDRIAIMSAGRIICSGSSLFLTKLFGKGYKLRVECMKSKRHEILNFINRFFEGAKPVDATSSDDANLSISPSKSLKSRKDKVVDFVVELTTSQDAEMELIKLLETFETEGEKLGLKSYGLKSSSIEDVMLNTSKYFVNEPKESQTKLTLNTTSNHIATLVNSNSTKGWSTYGSQIYALLVKMLFTYYNDYKTVFIYRLLMPTIGFYGIISDIYLPEYRPLPLTALITFHTIYYPVLERVTKFKTMQLTSQLKITTYWFCFLLSDLVSLMVHLIILNILLAIVLPSSITVVHDLHLTTSLALAAFFVASLAFSYMLSMIMNDHKTAMGYYWLISLMGLFLWLLLILVRLVLFANSKRFSLNWLNYIAVAVLPNDAFSYILYCLTSEKYMIRQAFLVDPDNSGSIWYGFSALIAQTIVYTALLGMAERQNIDLEYYTRFRNIFKCCFANAHGRLQQEEIDSDVQEEYRIALGEIDKVQESRTTLDAAHGVGSQENSYSLIAANLNKSYLVGRKVVENLSFTVHSGECFGLLGVNGAGKTTTFSIIVAETQADAGKVWANGYYVHEKPDKFRNHLGFDPQASPELLLTPYQALYLMARLRGLHDRSIPMLVDSVCELLDMSEHKHKLASNLSGGTKRKLALGMSLIGTPRLLVLDEPTAGVDPLARRGIWQLLKSLRKQNKVSIVISSHAMEECEAICDRISIMARGHLRCIGSFLHLRSKFAHGCSLRIQIASSGGSAPFAESPTGSRALPSASHNRQVGGGNESELQQIDQIVSELQQQLEAAIGSSCLKLADKNVNSATFNITDNRVRRSILFRIMREFRQKHVGLNLSYTLNDSSLEDIFISLARENQEQLEDKERRFLANCCG